MPGPVLRVGHPVGQRRAAIAQLRSRRGRSLPVLLALGHGHQNLEKALWRFTHFLIAIPSLEEKRLLEEIGSLRVVANRRYPLAAHHHLDQVRLRLVFGVLKLGLLYFFPPPVERGRE